MINEGELKNMSVPASSLHHRDDDGAPLSPSRLAEDWGVHVNTVYRDIRKGALRAFKLPSGRFRIRRDDARRYGRPIE